MREWKTHRLSTLCNLSAIENGLDFILFLVLKRQLNARQLVILTSSFGGGSSKSYIFVRWLMHVTWTTHRARFLSWLPLLLSPLFVLCWSRWLAFRSSSRFWTISVPIIVEIHCLCLFTHLRNHCSSPSLTSPWCSLGGFLSFWIECANLFVNVIYTLTYRKYFSAKRWRRSGAKNSNNKVRTSLSTGTAHDGYRGSRLPVIWKFRINVLWLYLFTWCRHVDIKTHSGSVLFIVKRWGLLLWLDVLHLVHLPMSQITLHHNHPHLHFTVSE